MKNNELELNGEMQSNKSFLRKGKEIKDSCVQGTGGKQSKPQWASWLGVFMQILVGFAGVGLASPWNIF